ncbi:MAG TPA: sensor domain-containing protein [Steroidobacteraceae bacterium]|nr:sensor domain-containing protein [Gammaproteobacteria bacterium]HEV2287206.1 sensor domain-containing protein [Steroidobacteraceae bacterium]
MTAHAPRSIDEYLRQLRAALEGQDPALIQDALYDAEEYLRAEVAAHPGKSEADVLELIASTYGAPEEVASAYRDTEAKVKAALKTPVPAAATSTSGWKRFFGVYLDPRSYTSLFYMLLTLATGIVYFTIVVTGLSLSFGFAILIIGVPFFLAFIGVTRVIALGEGRLIEAISGERMPRRPVHPGPAAGWWKRIGEMLADVRTWTTLAYLVLMLPLGIVYFTVAVTGLAVSAAFIGTLATLFGYYAGWIDFDLNDHIFMHNGQPWAPHHPFLGALFLAVLGVVLLTLLLHLARGVVRMHARLAKAMLVVPGA